MPTPPRAGARRRTPPTPPRRCARSTLSTHRPIAILCPGAEYGPAKRWPTEHFVALAQRACSTMATPVWLVGSPNDQAAAECRIAAGARASVRDLTGRTDLGTAIDLLSLGRARRQQRLGPDARGGRGRPAAGRALRLIVARLHAAALAPRHASPGSTSHAAPASSASVRSAISSACASSSRGCRVRSCAQRRGDAPARPSRCPNAHGQARTPPIFTSPQDAALAFYQAFEAKDIEAMMAAWAEDEDIVCVHPGGARLVGYEAVRAGWEQLFAGDTQALVPARRDRRHRNRRPGDAERHRAHDRGQRSEAARRGDRHQRLPAHAVGLAHRGAPLLAGAGGRRHVRPRGPLH